MGKLAVREQVRTRPDKRDHAKVASAQLVRCRELIAETLELSRTDADQAERDRSMVLLRALQAEEQRLVDDIEVMTGQRPPKARALPSMLV